MFEIFFLMPQLETIEKLTACSEKMSPEFNCVWFVYGCNATPLAYILSTNQDFLNKQKYLKRVFIGWITASTV